MKRLDAALARDIAGLRQDVQGTRNLLNLKIGRLVARIDAAVNLIESTGK